VESTHNRCGGTILPASYLQAVRAIADHANVPVHLDGSRIFNAAIALNCDVKTFTQQVDSVQFCLSKGLAAPVGSLVCGDVDFIARARRLRKMVGGGMRQAGVIAAAGIVALKDMIDRLAEDHQTARALATGLADLPGMQLDLETVQTNIVIFGPKNPPPEGLSFAQLLAREGVQVGDIGGGRFRAVTHYGISTSDIESALRIMRKVWREVLH
jgi:threonine aldolase